MRPERQVAPARPALPIGQIDAEDLPPPVTVDRHRDQHRLADDHPGLADFLVACVEDEVRERLFEPPLGKRAARPSSSVLLIWLIDEAEKLCPHSASVTAFTFCVETPCTYISASVPTKDFSER